MKRFTRIFIPAVLLLIALSVVVWGARPQVAAQDTTEQLTIEQRDIDVTVDGTGAVSPERTLHLVFNVAETVATVNVEPGHTVSEGDVLATLDTVDLQLQVDLAEQSVIAQQANLDSLLEDPTELELAQVNASIASAQANLAQATLSQETSDEQILVTCASLEGATDRLETAQDTYDDYVQAGYEVDPAFLPDPDSQAGQALNDAQTNYDVTRAQCSITEQNMSNDSSVASARAQLAQAEASRAALQDGPAENQLAGTRSQLRTAELQLEQAKNRLADAILVAPFDGTVTDVAIVEDQQVGTGTVAVTLVEDTQFHVMTRVDELDISSVAIGQPATITLDALDEMTLAGEVSRIAPQATTQQGITTYDVRVNLSETAENLRLGMSADVEILVDTLQDVLVVPRRAIQRNDELGEFITVQSGDSERDVAVTPGYSAGGLIVVEGNIEVGQTIIIPEDNR